MSYGFSVLYVKIPADPADRSSQMTEALRARFGRVDPAGEGWLACGMGDWLEPEEAFDEDDDDDADAPPRAASAGLAAEYGEAIYLFADSGADELRYDHSQGQKILRKLSWTSDGLMCTWSAVAGAPEPWEETLFSQGQQDFLLGCMDESDHDSIRETYAARVIRQGARWPNCDATVADLIERHFGITRPPKKRA